MDENDRMISRAYLEYLNVMATSPDNFQEFNSILTENPENFFGLHSLQSELQDPPRSNVLAPQSGLPDSDSEPGSDGTVQPKIINKTEKSKKSRRKQVMVLEESNYVSDSEFDFRSAIPKVVNVTATLNLNFKINLDQVNRLRNTYFDRTSFPGLVMKLKNPKSTALIFDTGKIVCIGTNSIQSSRIACRKYARIIQRLGYPVKFKHFKVRNVVSQYTLPFIVDLESLNIGVDRNPEFKGSIVNHMKFPGMILKIGIGKICAKVFESSKVIITGAKNMEMTRQAFEKIYPIIERHRKRFIKFD